MRSSSVGATDLGPPGGQVGRALTAPESQCDAEGEHLAGRSSSASGRPCRGPAPGTSPWRHSPIARTATSVNHISHDQRHHCCSNLFSISVRSHLSRKAFAMPSTSSPLSVAPPTPPGEPERHGCADGHCNRVAPSSSSSLTADCGALSSGTHHGLVEEREPLQVRQHVCGRRHIREHHPRLPPAPHK